MHPLLTQYIWQIAESYLPELFLHLRQRRDPQLQVLPKAYDAVVQASGQAKGWNDYLTAVHSPDKSVLVLPVSGAMSREGYWNFGNAFFVRQLNAALKDDQYRGAVLSMHTPGGTVDSTPEFAQAVAAFRAAKPITVATAYCASAGYYVASQADEIHMEDQAVSSVGSIGVLMIYENWKKHLEQEGIHMEYMRATKSKDKGLVNWIEDLPEEARAELQDLLDACQAEFEGAVKRGRTGKITSEEAFTGKMYGTSQAIKLGLVDRKGNLQTAVKRVLELSK